MGNKPSGPKIDPNPPTLAKDVVKLLPIDETKNTNEKYLNLNSQSFRQVNVSNINQPSKRNENQILHISPNSSLCVTAPTNSHPTPEIKRKKAHNQIRKLQNWTTESNKTATIPSNHEIKNTNVNNPNLNLNITEEDNSQQILQNSKAKLNQTSTIQINYEIKNTEIDNSHRNLQIWKRESNQTATVQRNHEIKNTELDNSHLNLQTWMRESNQTVKIQRNREIQNTEVDNLHRNLQNWKVELNQTAAIQRNHEIKNTDVHNSHRNLQTWKRESNQTATIQRNHEIKNTELDNSHRNLQTWKRELNQTATIQKNREIQNTEVDNPNENFDVPLNRINQPSDRIKTHTNFHISPNSTPSNNGRRNDDKKNTQNQNLNCQSSRQTSENRTILPSKTNNVKTNVYNSSNSGNNFPKNKQKENYPNIKNKGYASGSYNLNRNNNLPNKRKDTQQNRNCNFHRSEIENRPMNVDFNNGQKPNRKRFLGFRKLEEIYQMEPEIIIIELQNADLETVLNSNLSPDFIVLILRILAKIALSSFVNNKFVIVNLISSEIFLKTLFNYVTRLYAQSELEIRRNQYFWKEPDFFFNDLFNMCHMMIDIAPSMACDKLVKIIKSYEVASELLKSSEMVTICEETNQKFTDLKLKFDMCVEEQEIRKLEMNQESVEEEEPPEDFREISVYPTSDEIILNIKPFVRKNIIEGPYKNVEHYLDIQFRLLREDFVAPLRKGIYEYREIKTTTRLKDSSIKVHENVYFLCNKIVNDQMGVVIQLAPSLKKQKRKQKIENSKQFMYGSLMCFTNDNFATLMFGKILESNKELSENNRLIIGFEKEYHSVYEFDKPYTMLESKAYFEPYYHVLMALQHLDPEYLSMQQYLIYVNPEIKPPHYLYSGNGSLMLKKNLYRILNNPFISSRLRDRFSEFDESQFIAFRNALTEEFVVIQGPPGTGKTHLGLKIAETLLENKRLWNNCVIREQEIKIPMLVVCFTNHALDQFLEGLLQFTDKIVRVGGQSKNEKLKNYSLKEQKKKIKIGGKIGHALYEARKHLEQIFAEIKAVNETIDCIIKNDGILNVKSLWCIDNKIGSSWFQSATIQEVIDWFFGGRDQQRLDLDQQNDQLLEIQVKNDPGNSDEIDSEEEVYEEIDENIDADDRDEIEIDESKTGSFNMPHYILNIKTMEEAIKSIVNRLMELKNQHLDMDSYLEQQELKRDYLQAKENLQFLKEKLKEREKVLRENPKKLKTPQNIDYRIPTNMKSEDRWDLYYYWIINFLNRLFVRSKMLQQDYSNVYKQYVELKDRKNLQLIRTMDVVGMTTTGAARLQTTLQSLKCRVVIVEEAAEVLESHIVVSLTKHCQHLLLIGDHQQLRPSTADYHIETNYKLGISLFERMVLNNIHLNTLKVQHRMRPEIAMLIVPAIYPELQNHESVLNFPPIMGISSPLFFITHNEPEEECDDSSKKNNHEAKYLILLARYLVLNGYKPEDITILAAYSGQMFNLLRERKNYGTVLGDVRITVVDNYQGEECKIILLSLVRNNSEGNIGFLKIENRVCVALSRAKEGFYIMGNMQLLVSKSHIWPKIKGVLEKQNALGTYLTVCCQIHQDQVTRIEKLEDFNKVPEGGCLKMCQALLNCGHTCKKCCHLIDRNHETFRCTEPCSIILCGNGHQCPKKCFEDCGECMALMKRILPCQHEQMVPCYMDPNEFRCTAMVDIVLSCDHKMVKPCFMDPKKVNCTFPCETRIEPCGHACVMTCHAGKDPDHLEYKCTKPCSKPKAGCSTGEHPCRQMCYEICKPCEVIILKQRTKCSHAFNTKCNLNVDELECRKPCTRQLPCGHKCVKNCDEPCGGCNVKIEKIAPCSHKVKIECSKNPTGFDCRRKCTLLLACGHPCQNRCNQTCTISCKVLVKSNKPSDCGHIVDVPCCLRNEEVRSGNFNVTKYCSSPCGQKLVCGHKCHGTCGSCAQGRIHVTCSEKCEFPLVCGHVCHTPCRASCPPCNQKCTYSCVHSKCPRKCGQPCVDCKEPCPRRCQHLQCENYCGLPCSVPPCTERCPRRLPCGHDCIGFCGDPCPHLCRICDKKELTSFILTGNEEDDDARFVKLLDCQHVIENEGMETWLSTTSERVSVKTCPRCNCPMTTTFRYSDYIKKANKMITVVKEKCVGSRWKNDRKQKQLLHEIKCISVTGLNEGTRQLVDQELLQELEESLKPNGRGRRNNNITAMLLDSIEAKIDVIKRILEKIADSKITEEGFCNVYTYFLFERLLKIERMSDQTRLDFSLEITRFNRIIQLAQIKKSVHYKNSQSHPTVKSAFKSARDQLFICKRWSDCYDNKAKETLQFLNKVVQGTTIITDEEKRQIIAALNMQRGHWFACPNGHPYIITECGGAMEESNCPACGERIGGSHHRLLKTNRLASEMDGARYAACPDIATHTLNY